jgi:alkylated DNA repair dioxygenase AlkB
MARQQLSTGHELWAGSLPDRLILDGLEFKNLWDLHPVEYHEIRVPGGKLVKTPRWQQAYGQDYAYTGSVSKALALDTLTGAVPKVERMVTWCRESIDDRLNGLLLNWYDGSLGHYIGKHHDSTRNMVEGAPIVTISFGEARLFRLRPPRGQGGFVDFDATHGAVFVMPYDTNLAWTHEVPRAAKRRGLRISITLRAFR